MQGVKVSISPDDPGFFDNPGVTLDYLVAYIAWGLDLTDLRKLALNSLDHCTLPQNEKDEIRVFFEYKWIEFLQYVRGRY